MVLNKAHDLKGGRFHSKRAVEFSEIYRFLKTNEVFRVVAMLEVSYAEGPYQILDIDNSLSYKLGRYLSGGSLQLAIFKVGSGRYLIGGIGNNLDKFKVSISPRIRIIENEINDEFHGIECRTSYSCLVDFRDLLTEQDFQTFLSNVGDHDISKIASIYHTAVIKSFKAFLIESTRETAEHCERVKMYNEAVANAMHLPEEDIYRASVVGWLHDLGKVVIEDAVLDKPSKLTPEEFKRISEHSTIGWRIVKFIPGLEEISLGIKHHHERYDGRGYPDNLKGDDIPLLSRIVSVTDVFDTILSRRVYKEPQPISYALEELKGNSGTQFDPDVVSIFIGLVQSGIFDDLLKMYYNE